MDFKSMRRIGHEHYVKYVDKHFDITALFTAYKFDWDDKYSYVGECHVPWEIVFVKNGLVECTEDERVYTLKKNDIIIHAPLEFHTIRSIKSSTSVLILSFLANGELPGELSNGIFALNDKYRNEFMEIFDSTYAFLNEGPKNAYSGQGIVNRLSSFLIRLGSKTPEEQLSLSKSAVEYRRIASAMADNICENLSLVEFAKMCNVSISYVKLLFQKYAAISPMNYYANLRVQYAMTLLESGMTVNKISEIMNFSSPNYFSIFFKKHTGEMPSKYRSRSKS